MKSSIIVFSPLALAFLFPVPFVKKSFAFFQGPPFFPPKGCASFPVPLKGEKGCASSPKGGKRGKGIGKNKSKSKARARGLKTIEFKNL
jgi:hypothetical protein